MTERFSVGDTDVLIVIDIQNDFCSGGALAVPGGETIIGAVNRLGVKFAHVVLTQDWHPRGHLSFASSHSGRRPFETITLTYGAQILWPDHCVRGTRGAEFHPKLEIPHAELILRKGTHRAIDSYSAFFENDRTTPTGLCGYLRERGFTRVVLAGLAFDYCVRYSAEDALQAGFSVAVVENASRGLDVEGSLDAARKSFMERGVSCLDEASIAGSARA